MHHDVDRPISRDGARGAADDDWKPMVCLWGSSTELAECNAESRLVADDAGLGNALLLEERLDTHPNIPNPCQSG